MSRRPRLPTVVRFPFGFKIRIRYVNKKRMRALAGDTVAGLWSLGDGEPEYRGTIYIAQYDPYHEQLDSIGHELDHAVTDFRHHVDLTYRRPLLAEIGETIAATAESDE